MSESPRASLFTECYFEGTARKNCRTRAEPESLPMQTPKIVTARKLEAQVQSVAITAFAPSHDALNSLARIHSLHFHQLPDYDRETARECSSVLAHFSYQCFFRTSPTGRFKIVALGSRPVCAGHDACVGLDLRPIGLCPATGFVPDYLNRHESGSQPLTSTVDHSPTLITVVKPRDLCNMRKPYRQGALARNVKSKTWVRLGSDKSRQRVR